MVNPVSGGDVTLDHILAAEFIQKAFRRFLMFRYVRKIPTGDDLACYRLKRYGVVDGKISAK